MKHNKHKIEMIDDVNIIIGLLSTLRTVETSPLNTRHWVNPYIELLSELRNLTYSDADECQSCKGDGADYPAYAESIYDAEACPGCYGYGFVATASNLADIFKNIQQVAQINNASSISSQIDILLEKPMFRD